MLRRLAWVRMWGVRQDKPAWRWGGRSAGRELLVDVVYHGDRSSRSPSSRPRPARTEGPTRDAPRSPQVVEGEVELLERLRFLETRSEAAGRGILDCHRSISSSSSSARNST